MAGNEVIEYSKSKLIRQPPSVPFLWEEMPGIAKKDWSPMVVVSSVTEELLALPPPPPPVKLIASVPFNWEEKPGKPLSCFSESKPVIESPVLALLPPPPMYSQFHSDSFDLEMESFGFETDDSDSTAPSSLLANCLVSTFAVSAAVPVEESLLTDDIGDLLETPASPGSESDSSTSSYATGVSSLTGSSFLECLFPLHPPKSGLHETLEDSENGSRTPPKLQHSNSDYEGVSIIKAKKAPTLGELIMMSRRRSCQRKATQLAKKYPSREFMNTKPFGCCIFGTGITMIEGFQRKRHIARLKLV
ncbi:uncharacterized protein LOC126674211 [Mercurialis annua]|uniref:uncharacterized protein LOC126674211 n=1 Tax=Mercurialis annua TaxID=3986 RepID=UPI00215E6616|nr:uncharacterized protein LOC126674211 [Mercurialis annua]